ncbi:MAG: bacterial transcriptional activator domain-containing protein [Desulfitobacteriaceae bacterium]
MALGSPVILSGFCDVIHPRILCGDGYPYTRMDVPAVLERAAALYQRDFLPHNLYDDWAASVRTQLQHLYLEVLLKQVQSYRQQSNLPAAIQACRHPGLPPIPHFGTGQ